MLQKNIDIKAQTKRRKEAFQSAIISSILLLLTSFTKLWLRWYYQLDNFCLGRSTTYFCHSGIGNADSYMDIIKNKTKGN